MNRTAANRRAILAIIEPLFEAIEKRRAELEAEVLQAYEATGFEHPDCYEWGDSSPEVSHEAWMAQIGWEILPHQYVWSKLFTLQTQLEDELRPAITGQSIDNVKTILAAIQEAATLTFTEVEEFLNSPLSRMKKDEWERLPSWGDWINDRGEHNWSIGTVPMLDNFGFGALSHQETLEKLENAIHN